MKLKNLAALIFRIIGALYLLYGFSDLVETIGEAHDLATGIIESAGACILGYGLIRYSKKLAALFCKGLDDDAA